MELKAKYHTTVAEAIGAAIMDPADMHALISPSEELASIRYFSDQHCTRYSPSLKPCMRGA